MVDIKPVTNYGLIAQLAIENGCDTLGELLVALAMRNIRPSPADVKVMSRVYAEYASSVYAIPPKTNETDERSQN